MLARWWSVPMTVLVVAFLLFGLSVDSFAADDSAADDSAAVSVEELGQEEQTAGAEARELAEEAIHEEGVAHGDSHGEANANPLEFKKDLAIWTAVVFLFLLVILKKFAWGPIVEGLDRREQRIANEIAQAKESNETAREILGEYQAKLDAAGGEVRGMLDQARRDADANGRKIVEAAQEEAVERQKQALAEIDSATANALGELATRSADLAVGLAGKIVRSELKRDDHATLVDQAVDGFVQKKPE